MKKIAFLMIVPVILCGFAACRPENKTALNAPEQTAIATTAGSEAAAPAQTGHADTPAPSASPNFEAEKKVYELFSAPDNGAKDTEKIIAALPGINWSEYETYTHGKAIELIDWLCALTVDDKDEILSLMLSTDGLDGAFSEGYAGVLGRIYRADPDVFIQSLAKTDQNHAAAVCSLVAYDCGYGAYDEAKEAMAETTRLIDGGTLSDAETAAAKQLIDAADKGVD